MVKLSVVAFFIALALWGCATTPQSPPQMVETQPVSPPKPSGPPVVSVTVPTGWERGASAYPELGEVVFVNERVQGHMTLVPFPADLALMPGEFIAGLMMDKESRGFQCTLEINEPAYALVRCLAPGPDGPILHGVLAARRPIGRPEFMIAMQVRWSPNAAPHVAEEVELSFLMATLK